jgi:hypothetical protein
VAGVGLAGAARGVAVVQERAQHAALDQDGAARGRALGVEGAAGEAVLEGGVVDEREALAGDALAEPLREARLALGDGLARQAEQQQLKRMVATTSGSKTAA